MPAAYVATTVLFSSYLRRFDGGVDEGFNLAKAALVARGHSLYDEVWSDQPPLLTAMLRALFAVTGESVTAARLLVLASSAALLWGVARTARLAGGWREALAATFLLLAVPPFQPLSVSVMVGLPAVAFAAVALALASDGARPAGGVRVVASGAALALGVLTKLQVAILAPVLLAASAAGAPRGARALRGLAWSSGFVATAVVGFLALASPAALDMLVTPHWAGATDPGFRRDPELGLLRQAAGLEALGILALVGAVVSWRRGAPPRWPLAWAVVATAALSLHRPVWPHHLLLLTVPGALLAAPAVVAAAAALARRAGPGLRRRGLRVAMGVAAAVGATWLVADAGRWRRPRPASLATRREEAFVDGLRALAHPGDAILTDRPMYAFRAGIPVVPEAAVLSLKRVRTGLLTEEALLDLVSRERPRLVHLERFPFPTLRAALRARYRVVVRRPPRELFVLDRPGEPPPACAWPRCLDLPVAWYGGPEALRLVEDVLAAQHADGGWAKGEDHGFSRPLGGEDPPCDGVHVERCSTFDNDATTAEMRFLARVHAATGDARAAPAFVRALDLVLSAQNAAGGWPQVPAARSGTYPAAITLNDDAMARVMDLLDDVVRDPAYAFVDGPRRERARTAFSRGVDCLVRAQVRVRERPTVWCAQHDPVTLAPVAARSFEPPSLSGHESVGAVRTLMRVERPPPDVVAAVDAALAWFESARLEGDGEPRWARFYDLATGVPLFPDRDGSVHAAFEDLSEERRLGYRYFTDAPRALLETDAPRWRARVALSR